MKKIIAHICFLFCITSLNGQIKINPELAARLNNKTDFYEIKNTVLDYYSRQKSNLNLNDTAQRKSINRQLKFWNRWFWESEARLDPDGKVANWSKRMVDAEVESIQNNNPSNNLANSDWTLVGPTVVGVEDGIGRVSRLAFHPANSQIVYAGTARGGLWRSINGGSTWSALSSFLPSLGVSGIEVANDNGNVIYILTGEGDAWFSGGFTFNYGYVSYSNGVFKSTDGGLSWTKTAEFTPGFDTSRNEGFQLRQDPNNSNTLLAATSLGIYRTTNGGNSWAAAAFKDLDSFPTSAAIVGCFDIEYKPGSSSIVYAGCYKVNGSGNISSYALFRSTDGGLNFYEQWPVSPSTVLIRFEIGVSPAAPNNVYLACGPGYVNDGDGSNDTFYGFYRSTNSGISFTQLTDEPDIWAYNPGVGPTMGNQCMYDMALAISPTNTNNIFTGGLIVCRSTNGGNSFSYNTTYWTWEAGETIHPDVHDLKFNPLNGRLYAATDGGVYYTDDNGTSWTAVFNGMSITQFYHSEPDNENNKLWGGTQDNGVMQQESGGVFSEFEDGDGYDVMTDNPVGNGNDSYWTTNGELLTTRNTGTSDITPPKLPNGNENRNFGNLDMHPVNEDYIYVGYSDAVWYSNDQGASWDIGNVLNRIAGGNVRGEWCIQTCPSNSGRLYTAGGGNMWRVDNINFTNQSTGNESSLRTALINAGFPSNAAQTALRKVTDILVHPSSSAELWVTAGGFTNGAKVFHSTNSGTNWTNISFNLPNVPANCLLRDTDGTIYAGMDNGVFYLPPGGTAWIPFSNDLPRVPVTEMNFVFEINPTITKYIYASTFGRGIWKTQTFTGCAATVNVTQTLRGQYFFQAGNTLTSTSLVDGVAGTDVKFQSGNNVTLNIPFEAKTGTVFVSKVQACNTGGLRPALKEPGVNPQTGKREFSGFYKFGNIQVVEVKNNEAVIRLEINTVGQYALQIVNENNQVVKTIFPYSESETGKRNYVADISSLPKGSYHVQLYYEDELIHLQEMNRE